MFLPDGFLSKFTSLISIDVTVGMLTLIQCWDASIWKTTTVTSNLIFSKMVKARWSQTRRTVSLRSTVDVFIDTKSIWWNMKSKTQVCPNLDFLWRTANILLPSPVYSEGYSTNNNIQLYRCALSSLVVIRLLSMGFMIWYNVWYSWFRASWYNLRKLPTRCNCVG